MAQKRMFSLSITNTDSFLDMPTSAQALYFHLGMHGDDDGFVGSPRKIMRAAGCNEDDAKLLAAKGYILVFDNGVIVIRDWKLNNTLKNDRYHHTIYQSEMAQLTVDRAGRYLFRATPEPTWNQLGTNLEPERNLTESNETEVSQEAHPSVQKVATYIAGVAREKGLTLNADDEAAKFVDYYGAVGWKIKGSEIVDWRGLARKWLTNIKAYPDSAKPDTRSSSDDFWKNVPFY